MRRAAIRDAVDEALAAKGYATHFYKWDGCWLQLVTRSGGMVEHHLPSGTSKKNLTRALESIKAIGAPRGARALAAKSDTYRQTDIMDFMGEGRQ